MHEQVGEGGSGLVEGFSGGGVFEDIGIVCRIISEISATGHHRQRPLQGSEKLRLLIRAEFLDVLQDLGTPPL